MEERTDPGSLTAPAPVAEKNRIHALDVVRGFALLGILVPNIVAFGWPAAAMTDPAIMDATLGGNRWNTIGHDLTSIFTLGKMMALFSMLFGVGVIVYARKFDEANASERLGPDAIDRAHRELGENITYTCKDCGYDLAALLPEGTIAGDATCPECGVAQHTPRRLKLSTGAGLWYRRTLWLLAIGACHALFIWFGDILVWYAVTGLAAVWWLRRLNPKLQITLGVLGHLASTVLLLGASLAGVWAIEHGKIPEGTLMGDPVSEFEAYTGGVLDATLARLVSALSFWFMFLPLFLPGVTGLMLIGMGLARLGIITGARSTRYYAVLASVGTVGGLALTTGLFYGLEAVSPTHGSFLWQSMSQFVGIPISLGYMALLIWILKLGILRLATTALANVGRMALSNYLLQSLLCTTFFYGHAGGYYGKVDYPGLFAVIAGVWIINLVFSAAWLRFFRFGPAEWAWRSLNYWKPQPLRR